MTDEIDLAFRPKTYFRTVEPRSSSQPEVKGTVLRRMLRDGAQTGAQDEVQNTDEDSFEADAGFSSEDIRALEQVHPMFMGGNYLPDPDEGEVEIARISIQSTTCDVTSVYARLEGGVIHYRVVDEYEGDTLQGPSEATTTVPMTLGELADFLLTAWPLTEVLETNFENNLDGALEFFSAESDFYPQLDFLCRHRVIESFPDGDEDSDYEAGDRCPYCKYFNSPPADDLCEHAVALVWDGQVEAFDDADKLQSALGDLEELVSSADEDSSVETMLDIHALRSPTRKALVDCASVSLAEALETLAEAQSGGGWSTNGILGGSGYTLYMRDKSDLGRLFSECEAIVRGCSLQVQTETGEGLSPDARRPGGSVQWMLVASGDWSEGVYHSGHIAYYLASTAPGCWIMESRERNTFLDDVTEEDVDEGRLNDEQIQAMWGQTLEEAQNQELQRIVAWAEGVDPIFTSGDVASILYRAVCKDGGKKITDVDDRDGLLDSASIQRMGQLISGQEKPFQKSGGRMPRRRAARAVLLDAEDSSGLDHWAYRIELRRNASATFAVWGNKFGENPETGRRGRFGWQKTEGLKSPLAIKRAIEDSADSLSARFEWEELIPRIGTIDWVTASVVASAEGLEIPALPEVDDLLSQRSLRALGKVKIGAAWGDEIHELELSFERWVRILAGEGWETDKPYWYEGRRFTATWSFDGEGQLEVTYDDAGVGWEGTLADLAVIEGPKLDDVDLASLALNSARPEA